MYVQLEYRFRTRTRLPGAHLDQQSPESSRPHTIITAVTTTTRQYHQENHPQITSSLSAHEARVSLVALSFPPCASAYPESPHDGKSWKTCSNPKNHSTQTAIPSTRIVCCCFTVHFVIVPRAHLFQMTTLSHRMRNVWRKTPTRKSGLHLSNQCET
jgi:hypothetical protein